jgi:NADP-dependent 3-hydroxy acid dehydrogenase YdfG
MPVSLQGECVLVVGASSGVGRAAAVLFAREGARVLASARRADRLQQLKDELEQEGHAISVFQADAGDPAQMNALTAAAIARMGKVDILVYASGTNTLDRSLQRLSAPVWNELIQVNLNGAFYIASALLPRMREARKGHLIFVSSISGLRPDVSGAAYQASKRGLLGLAHAIRVEEKENNIRTCVVCPGLIDTEILLKRPVKPSAETLAQALRAEDVAEAILDVARFHPRVTIAELEIVPTTL